MSDQPAQPRPNRQARRSLKRPGGGQSTNPAMGALRQLELASRGLIRRAMATADTSGPDGAGVTPEGFVLLGLTSDSPANGLLPENARVQPGMVSVRFAERMSLARALVQQVGEEAGSQIARPHPCGHWWVLLSTKETSRFCCTRCDLKIEQDAS